MRKLNKIAYDRLMAQAEEAKELGLQTLAQGILTSIGSSPKEELETYSSIELQDDLHNNLWKAAINVLVYHDVKTIDASKVEEVVQRLASQFLIELEESIGTSDKVGNLEPKLPGEK